MEGGPTPEEDFSGLSIAERLAHKNWKARVNGYEYLSKAFSQTGDESDPVFKPYLQNPETLKKMALDANAVAQEKGLECVLSFVKFSGELAAKYVLNSLIEDWFWKWCEFEN